MDSKHRLTIPVTLAPWAPGDYVEITYIKGEDAFVAQRIKDKTNWPKLLKKAARSGDDSAKPNRKKAKKNR